MTHYELRHGSYCLLDDATGDILNMSDEVAIGFSVCVSHCILTKHGSHEQVKNWIEKAQKAYFSAGLDNEAKSLMMVSGKFPIEEINKILTHTGYLDHFLKDNNFGQALDEIQKIKEN